MTNIGVGWEVIIVLDRYFPPLSSLHRANAAIGLSKDSYMWVFFVQLGLFPRNFSNQWIPFCHI